MDKAINQNDLVDIISAHVDAAMSVTDIVFSNLIHSDVHKRIKPDDLKSWKENASIIFGNDSPLPKLLECINELSKTKTVNEKHIKKIFNSIGVVLKSISDMKVPENISQIKSLSSVVEVIEKMVQIIKSINTISLKELMLMGVKIKTVKRAIESILKIFTSMDAKQKINTALITSLSKVTKLLKSIFEDMRTIIKIAPLISIGIKIVNIALLKMRGMIKVINIISNLIILNNKSFLVLAGAVKSIVIIFSGVIIAALLAPVAVVAMVVVMITLRLFMLLFKTIEKISKIISADVQAFIIMTQAVNGIKKIFVNVIIAALLAPFAIVAMILVMAALIFMWPMFLLISKIGESLDAKYLSSFYRLVRAINGIKKIFANVIIAALLAPFAIAAMIVVIISILFLALMMVTINMLLGIIPRHVGAGLKRVKNVILTIALISLVVIVTGVLAVLAIVAIIPIMIFMGLLVGFMFLVKIIANIVGKLAKQAIVDLFILLAVLMVIMLITAIVWIMSKMSEDITSKAGDIFISLAIITGVATAAVGLGMLAMGLAPIIGAAMVGLGLIMTVMFMMLLLAGMVWVIQKMNLDKDKIKENVQTVIDTCLLIQELLFGDGKESKESEESWFESVLSFLGNGLGMIIKAILAIAFLALSIVTILLILFLAGQLRLLQEIDLLPDKIKENVSTVIQTALQVVDELFNSEEKDSTETNKTWVEDVIDFLGLGGIAKIIKAIMAIGFLAMSLVAIYLIKCLAENLSYIQKIELKKTDILKKTNTVIQTGKAVMNELTKPDDTKDQEPKSWLGGLLDSIMPDALKDIIQAIKVMGKIGVIFACIWLLKSLAESLNTINEFPKMDGITGKVETIISTSDKLINKIIGKESEDLEFKKAQGRLDTLKKLVEVWDKFDDLNIDKTERLTNNYVKFLDKVNNVDLEKLKTTEQLFQRMAEFSNSISGNFDKLADSLNEKIAPLLEKLEKGVSDLNKDMNNNAKDQMKNDIEIANGAASPDSINKAAGGDKDTASKLQKDQAKKNEKDKKQYQGMQDIMDILLGQGGHKGVKIHN